MLKHLYNPINNFSNLIFQNYENYTISTNITSKVDKILNDVITTRKDGLLTEFEVYKILDNFNIKTPKYHFHKQNLDNLKDLPIKLPKDTKMGKFVAKAVLRHKTEDYLCLHKTDLGAIKFNIDTENCIQTINQFSKQFESKSSDFNLEGVVFAEMLPFSSQLGHEMLISGYQDPFFGPMTCFGIGGTIVEYLKKVMKQNYSNIMIPSLYGLNSFKNFLKSEFPLSQILSGNVRGCKQLISHDNVNQTLSSISEIMEHYSKFNPNSDLIIEELEINPAIVCDGEITALDGVLKVRRKTQEEILKKRFYSLSSKLDPKNPIKPLEKIKKLEEPKSIAIVGCSTKSSRNPCNVIMEQALTCGIDEKDVYPIHPKADNIQGIPTVNSLKQLKEKRNGEPVDLLVVGIPAKMAGPFCIEAINENVAESFEVITGGFGETKKGKKLQEQLKKTFDESDNKSVMVGPNTVGCWNRNGVNTVFVPSWKSSANGIGTNNVCNIAQSGAFMLSRLSDWGDYVYPDINISVGNSLDLGVIDFFEYHLLHNKQSQKDITTYALYLEGLKENEGIRFMQLIKKAKEMGKYVVVYKAGKSKAGAKATQSHTASIAGDWNMISSLLKHSGAIVCDTFEEFNNMVVTTSRLDGFIEKLDKKKNGEKVNICGLSNAGFEMCGLNDHLFTHGEKYIGLTNWDKSSLKKFEKVYKNFKITEVVDVSGAFLDTTPMLPDQGYAELSQVCIDDPNTDFTIISLVPECETLQTLPDEIGKPYSLFNKLKQIKENNPNKFFCVVCESGKRYQKFRDGCLKMKIPTFQSVSEAATTLSKIVYCIKNSN